MHVDRLRRLVKEGRHLTLDGAVEIAKAAPELLREMEALERAWKKARSDASYHCDQTTPTGPTAS